MCNKDDSSFAQSFQQELNAILYHPLDGDLMSGAAIPRARIAARPAITLGKDRDGRKSANMRS
jgi:hypothetical protein